MKSRVIRLSILGMVMLIHGTALAAGPLPAATPAEIVGAMQEWNSGSGYLIVNGEQYSLAPAVSLTDQTGASLPSGALEVGVQVGLLVQDGLVYQIILFQ